MKVIKLLHDMYLFTLADRANAETLLKCCPFPSHPTELGGFLELQGLFTPVLQEKDKDRKLIAWLMFLQLAANGCNL